MHSRRLRLLLSVVSATAFILTASSFGCGGKGPEPFVVLFCLDGASRDVIDDLRSERRLPAFERLIRSGTFGRMQSLPVRRIMKENLRRGYWSPVLWTTVATGKIPEKHGVRDFVLPIAGTSSVWMGSEDNPPRAELTLPELRGRMPLSLRLRLHSHGPDGEQSVHLLWNEESLETIRVPVKWKDFAIPLPEGRLRPARNRLALVFSRQSSPAEHGKSSDRRPLACELASLSVIDARGREVYSLDPAHQRFSLGRGFYLPRGSLTEVQSVHWRAKPVWSLLGELGHPVGIVGYWGTWPAYEVNGFLVSSRMGIREQRQASDRLTWPPELATELVSLAPHARDLEETFARLHVADCQPPLLNEKPALRKILLQDEFYFRIARRLLPSMDRGFFSVYFRSIDVASHVSLHWRHGAQLGVGCSESVREIVDEIYVQIDRWIGDLVEMLSNRATIVLVSDHGMKSIDFAGHHAPYGIFLSAGRGVRKGSAVEGASLLDVAPTILHIFGAPIPSDMDGHVLAQIFDTQWMESHPPRYVDMDTSLTSKEEALAEGTEEVLEELRAIGYIQ